MLVLPTTTPRQKIADMRALEAGMILHAGDAVARWERVCRIGAEKDFGIVHGVDNPRGIAGQEAMGCETVGIWRMWTL